MDAGLDRRDSGFATGSLLAAAALAAAAGLLLLYLQLSGGAEWQGTARAYTYTERMASDGVKLHVIRTRPDNVALRAIGTNVTDSLEIGVNGGFFYEGALLSMAVVDGKPVKGAYGSYGSGTTNAKVSRGTLVWDRAAQALSVQIVTRPEELVLKDRSRYWAQGGVSMSLGSDETWKLRALKERLPYPDEKRLRSGAVYDKAGRLYLVVSENRATADDFREAVKEQVGDGRLADGIFLDGDGSSQLRCREAQLDGDGRAVYQMIALLQ